MTTELRFPRRGDGAAVALVTGANHGIGAATAVALAAEGFDVLASYLVMHDEPDPGTPATYGEQRARDASEVVARIEALGRRAVAVEADLRDAATPARLFDLAEAELGPVRVTVNNASGWVADTFQAASSDRLGRDLRPVSPETFDAQFGVDARGGALMIAEHARRHLARGDTWGRIVALSSGGPKGFPEEVTYGAAKAALENYVMSAAHELARCGITANVVVPPVTDTGWVTDEVRRAIADHGSLFHIAEPEEVAAVVTWLCSDAAGLVTANRIELR